MEPLSIVMPIIEERYAFFFFVLVFMCLDIVSGLIGAFATNSFTSTKVKQGIFHKASLILIVLMAACIDVASGFIPSLPFTAPVTQGVCVLIIGMEAMSVLENACKANPSLKDTALIKKLLPSEDALRETVSG